MPTSVILNDVKTCSVSVRSQQVTTRQCRDVATFITNLLPILQCKLKTIYSENTQRKCFSFVCQLHFFFRFIFLQDRYLNYFIGGATVLLVCVSTRYSTLVQVQILQSRDTSELCNNFLSEKITVDGIMRKYLIYYLQRWSQILLPSQVI